jgi:hypothetical protein
LRRAWRFIALVRAIEFQTDEKAETPTLSWTSV